MCSHCASCYCFDNSLFSSKRVVFRVCLKHGRDLCTGGYGTGGVARLTDAFLLLAALVTQVGGRLVRVVAGAGQQHLVHPVEVLVRHLQRQADQHTWNSDQAAPTCFGYQAETGPFFPLVGVDLSLFPPNRERSVDVCVPRGNISFANRLVVCSRVKITPSSGKKFFAEAHASQLTRSLQVESIPRVQHLNRSSPWSTAPLVVLYRKLRPETGSEETHPFRPPLRSVPLDAVGVEDPGARELVTHEPRHRRAHA